MCESTTRTRTLETRQWRKVEVKKTTDRERRWDRQTMRERKKKMCVVGIIHLRYRVRWLADTIIFIYENGLRRQSSGTNGDEWMPTIHRCFKENIRVFFFFEIFITMYWQHRCWLISRDVSISVIKCWLFLNFWCFLKIRE